MPSQLAYTVNDSAAGQRIDNFLFKFLPGVPKSHIYQILRSGKARVNSAKVQHHYRLQLEDRVYLPPLAIAEGPKVAVIPPTKTLNILYEDEALLVIDKPVGMAVHGGSGVSWGVIEYLRHHHDAGFLELVHRLDRETSGVLLLAKKRQALVALHEQMRHGLVDKAYLAIVAGQWPAACDRLQYPLFKSTNQLGERCVRVQKNGKTAETVIRVMQQTEKFSLLIAQPKTGRTHQIRVHLAHHGFPILGDPKYGDFVLNHRLRQAQGHSMNRMALHAHTMSFVHPITAKNCKFIAPMPTEFQHFLQFLNFSEVKR